MPDEKIMSEQRHMQLIKAAEETIGLMNIGLNGESALAKVADDNVLSDHEVELVAHAVNNSKQLAHIQESAPEDRDKPFQVINSDNVKVQRQEPTTNADVNTGDRYAPQETMAETSAEEQDENDSLDTQKKILKDAAATTWEAPGDFRRRTAAEDHSTNLRKLWGLQENKVACASYEDPNPYAKNDYIRIGIEEGRYKAAQAKRDCEQILDKLAYDLRRVDAPAFAALEKVAYAKGVSRETMDLIYDVAGLGKFDVPRLQQKTASNERIYVSQAEADYAENCVRADTLWKAAADATVATSVLTDKKRAADEALDKLAQDSGRNQDKKRNQDKSGPAGNFLGAPLDVSVNVNPGDFGEPIEKAPEEFFVSPETIQGALGSPDEGEPIDSMEKALSQDVRQGIENVGGRAAIEDLMQDEYIGGHSLPDVVDAYNAAISVNPAFAHSKAQLVSYMRQHLATKGSVPLDLQLKARSKGSEGMDQ